MGGSFRVPTIVVCVLLSATMASAVKVSIEKKEIFAEDGHIIGHEDLGEEELAALRVQLVADYETFLVGEVPEEDLSYHVHAAREAELVSRIRWAYDLIQINGYLFFSSDEPHDIPEPLFIETYEGVLDFYLVQFNAPVKPEWRAELDAVGDVLAYYPENTYLVRVLKTSANLLSSVTHVQHVSLFQPAYKIQRDLLTVNQEVDVTFQFDANQNLNDASVLLGQLADRDVEIRGEVDAPRARARLDSSDLLDVLQWPEVLWVEPTLAVVLSGERLAMVVAGQHNGERPDDPGTGGSRSDYHDWLRSKGFCTPENSLEDCNPYWTKVGVFDTGLDKHTADSDCYDEETGLFTDRCVNKDLHFDFDHDSNPSSECPSEPTDCNDPIIRRFFCSEDTNEDNQCLDDGRYTFSDTEGEDLPTQAIGHGTAVASIIAGYPEDEISPEMDDGNFYAGTGVAPSAHLIIAKMGEVYDPDRTGAGTTITGYSEITYKNLMTKVEEFGTRFANNSWNLKVPWNLPPGGSGSATTTSQFAYNGYSQMMDRLVRDASGEFNDSEYSRMTLVFSAGNEEVGDTTTETFVYSPANAKNVISVGATRGFATSLTAGAATSCPKPHWLEYLIKDVAGGYQWDSRRMFPGDDDSGSDLPRYKPDLVAPGRHISAALTRHADHDPAIYYRCFAGTSAAAPAVTGAAVLVDAWYTWGVTPDYGESIPSPAMVKAMLVAHADTMRGGYDHMTNQTLVDSPAPPQGWGRVNLDELIQGTEITTDIAAIDEEDYDEEDPERRFTSTQYYWTGVFTPDDSRKHILIVLAFTDRYAEPAASGGSMVNDIDLKAYSSGGAIQYWGNSFVSNGWYSQSDLIPPTGIPDSHNNVEVIRVPAGTFTSDFTIRVSPRTIAGNAVPGSDSNASNQDWALYVYNAEYQEP